MILSVSRRTDVPNYYSDWFINRIKEGYLCVRNPMNTHQISRIDLSPEVVDCIVFWTKNPANMIDKLDDLREYLYYFQFTLTGYGKDIEPNLPDKRKVLIPTFQKLSNIIGKKKVIWRYDPILLNRRYTMDYHLKAFEEIARNLAGYTERVVISFVDLYAKTQRNTKELDIRPMTSEEMTSIAGQMAEISRKYNLKIESCAEQIDLQKVGIQHGSCIDKNLIETLLGCKLIGGKDKNQRGECGCFESIEVGSYNTCLNGCRYCYANFNDAQVNENIQLYDQDSALLCGRISQEKDKITVRKVKSLKDTQIDFDGWLNCTVDINDDMKRKALDFAKSIILSDNQYSRLLPAEIQNSSNVEDRLKIEIQRTYMGKLGELAFYQFLVENGKNVNIDGMFDIYEGQQNVDSFDFITRDGHTVDVKTGFRSIHTRLLVNIEQFDGNPKDYYVAVKINAVDVDSGQKLVDWQNITQAQIMGYAEYDFLKRNALIHNFGEGSARWRYYNELLGIDGLLEEF